MKRISWKYKIANFLARNLKSVKGGYLGRQRFILTTWIYRFLPLLGIDYCRLIEWRFILENLPRGRKLKILDVGSTASLFIHELAKYGKTFGIDSRPYFENLPKTIKFLQCDVLKMPFPDNYFDCVTVISVIEHIGLGAYGDPINNDGDFKATEELKRVLKTGGVLFVTTVVGSKYVVTPKGGARIYGKKRFDELFENFSSIKEEYYIFRRRWIPVDKEKAFLESPVFLPSLKGFGLACLQLTKKQKK